MFGTSIQSLVRGASKKEGLVKTLIEKGFRNCVSTAFRGPKSQIKLHPFPSSHKTFGRCSMFQLAGRRVTSGTPNNFGSNYFVSQLRGKAIWICFLALPRKHHAFNVIRPKPLFHFKVPHNAAHMGHCLGSLNNNGPGNELILVVVSLASGHNLTFSFTFRNNWKWNQSHYLVLGRLQCVKRIPGLFRSWNGSEIANFAVRHPLHCIALPSLWDPLRWHNGKISNVSQSETPGTLSGSLMGTRKPTTWILEPETTLWGDPKLFL